MRTKLSFPLLLPLVMLATSVASAEEAAQVQLEPPPSSAPAAQQEEAGADKGLLDLPDGVHNVILNRDGSLKSLVVRCTSDIELSLPDAQAKRHAKNEAEHICKATLSKYMQEEFRVEESAGSETKIVRNGSESVDANGNSVRVTDSNSEATKVFKTLSTSTSSALLRGLITLASDVNRGQRKEYVLVMGLSSKTITSAMAAGKALQEADNDSQPASMAADSPGPGGGSRGPRHERRVSPEAAGF